MLGLIGHFRAKPGRRDDLVTGMTQGGFALDGLIAFHVALDPRDPDAIWVTEVWRDRAAHEASLQVPQVAGSMDLLADAWGEVLMKAETMPVAGTGIA